MARAREEGRVGLGEDFVGTWSTVNGADWRADG